MIIKYMDRKDDFSLLKLSCKPIKHRPKEKKVWKGGAEKTRTWGSGGGELWECRHLPVPRNRPDLLCGWAGSQAAGVHRNGKAAE